MIIVIHKNVAKFYPKEQIVYIGRPSPLGNPFVIGKDGTRKEVIEKYSDSMRAVLRIKPNDSTYRKIMKEILKINRIEQAYGTVYLSCSCKPKACHGDIIKTILEEMK